ncbi:MAG: hypothetical protein ABI813_13590 [Bacteroidota bacterium]
MFRWNIHRASSEQNIPIIRVFIRSHEAIVIAKRSKAICAGQTGLPLLNKVCSPVVGVSPTIYHSILHHFIHLFIIPSTDCFISFAMTSHAVQLGLYYFDQFPILFVTTTSGWVALSSGGSPSSAITLLLPWSLSSTITLSNIDSQLSRLAWYNHSHFFNKLSFSVSLYILNWLPNKHLKIKKTNIMKALLILLMPLFIIGSFTASDHFFRMADYCTSAVFTLACLCSITLWITALSSKKLALD